MEQNKGEAADEHGRDPLENLAATRERSTERPTSELTKIHDQPRSPRMPDMKLIPYASRPENAPATLAAPKNRPMRYAVLWRGYHSVKLRACQREVSRASYDGIALVHHTGKPAAL